MRKTRQDGALRRAGFSQDEIDREWEHDQQGSLEEWQLDVRYGDRRSIAAMAPHAPGYQARGHMLLEDGQGRSYVPLGDSRSTEAYVYIDVGETRRRNARGEDTVEFPQPGDYVTLRPIRQRHSTEAEDTRTWTLRVESLAVERGRTASGTVEFSQSMPQRSEVERVELAPARARTEIARREARYEL